MVTKQYIAKWDDPRGLSWLVVVNGSQDWLMMIDNDQYWLTIINNDQ